MPDEWRRPASPRILDWRHTAPASRPARDHPPLTLLRCCPERMPEVAERLPSGRWPALRGRHDAADQESPTACGSPADRTRRTSHGGVLSTIGGGQSEGNGAKPASMRRLDRYAVTVPAQECKKSDHLRAPLLWRGEGLVVGASDEWATSPPTQPHHNPPTRRRTQPRPTSTLAPPSAPAEYASPRSRCRRWRRGR